MNTSSPYRENRPWGNFLELTHNTPSTVKIITVNPGQSLSLQFHEKRDEFWHVISGTGTIQIGEEKIDVVPGQDHIVPKLAHHRMEAGPDEPLVILEISTGEFDENDITRLEDRYGRA
jgi:mannose-6-phosphate isomerase